MSKASNLAGFVPSITPTNNLNVGVVTATSFSGNATGLTGVPNINVGILTASSATITGSVTVGGNVSIAGTLTYEDVTNVDSIGIITARSGVQVTGGSVVVGSAVTLSSGGITVGVVTATSFVGNLTGTASTSTASSTSFGLSGTPSVLVSSAGINTTSAPTKLYVSGNAASNIVGLGTTNANTVLDFGTGNNFSLQLTGSIVLSNPTGVTTGQSGIILIQQDSVGSRTCGFGSFWDFPSSTAPTLSTGANALDCITYFVRNSTSIVANSLIGIGTL